MDAVDRFQFSLLALSPEEARQRLVSRCPNFLPRAYNALRHDPKSAPS